MNNDYRPKRNLNRNSIKKPLLIAVVAIIALVILYHLLWPLLGLAIVFSAGAWAIIVLSVVLFSIGIMLFFIFPAMVVGIISLFAFVWVLLALMLFPFLFPVLIPIFILLLFFAYIRRKPPAA